MLCLRGSRFFCLESTHVQKMSGESSWNHTSSDQQAALEIALEAITSEVGTANEGNAPVHHKYLRVH